MADQNWFQRFLSGAFVVRKGAEYFIDSRYNSSSDKPSEPKAGSATLSAILFLLSLSILGTTAIAETYYCVPKDGGLFCKPVDFEHRTFEYDPPQVQQRGNLLYYEKEQRPFRCYGKGETYKCLPFDNGAVLLETPKTCPSTERNWSPGWFNAITPTGG